MRGLRGEGVCEGGGVCEGLRGKRVSSVYTRPLPTEERMVNMKDLEEAAEEEVGKTSTRLGFRRQDSDAARMYN